MARLKTSQWFSRVTSRSWMERTMRMPGTEAERCQTCGQTGQWHKDHPETKHPYNNGQDGSTDFLNTARRRDQARAAKSAQRGAEGPEIVSPGNDPVLRIALINRGILTPADLVVAEEQLRTALAEVQHAQQAEGTRRGPVQE